MREFLQDNLSPAFKFAIKHRLLALAASGERVVRRIDVLRGRAADRLARKGIDTRRGSPQNSSAPFASLADFDLNDLSRLSETMRGVASLPHAQNATIRSSIIIPVFNKAELTSGCLRSLLNEVDLRTTEIIVIDNASHDATPRVLAAFGDYVRVISNRENLGFVEGCNQGAAAARGRYLVFLNNDTIVLPGWLASLEATAARDDSIGAVGSMLLYPDGRIQEAGGGIWRDGTGFHYGWGERADDRRFNFARAVDYCSGASLLVRRDAFERLGGFDARYAPAYYEDTDLCFGLRKLGLKVVYQPRSRLIHYEGATAGTDITRGTKRYQEINRAKFVAKWAETLRREHFVRDPRVLEQAANRKRAPRLLVIDDQLPTPDRDSGSQRMMLLLELLAADAHVLFLPLVRLRGQEYEDALNELGIETVPIADFARLVKRGSLDAVIVSRPQAAMRVLKSVRRMNRRVPLIYDTVDLSFLRLEREHKLTGDARIAAEARRYRRMETEFARIADQVWCITEEEKSVLAREVPESRIRVVPNIHRLMPRGSSFRERRGLLFIGGFLHRPNRDAVNYFVREVLPHVRATLPHVEFHVVGGDVPDEIAAYGRDSAGGVVVHGRVAEVDKLFDAARVFVAPLRYGAGMKGKVGQALAYGLPIVTTSVGAEGMNLGAEVIIADDPRAFAESVIRLYTDEELWERTAEAGCRYIENTLSPPRVATLLRSHFAELGVEISPSKDRAPTAHDVGGTTARP